MMNAWSTVSRQCQQIVCASLSIGLLGLSSVWGVAAAEQFYILKDLSINTAKYENVPDFSTLTTVPATLNALGHSSDVAVHVSIIRSAFDQLPLDSHEPFLDALHERHREFHEDAMRFFDHGYAQFLFRQNKMALYHLRKANDRLKSPFTNLVYALAQVEIDLNEENASPLTMNTRKLNVLHLLTDAVVQDVDNHAPGFWAAYVPMLEKLATVPVYRDFVTQDFTQKYLPYGDRIMPSFNAGTGDDDMAPEICDEATEAPEDLPWQTLYRSVPIDLTGDGQNEVIHFFIADDITPESEQVLKVPPPTEETVVREEVPVHNYRVVVVNKANQMLADFISASAPYIIEDIDEDEIPELVVRQYRANKLKPLTVYRLNDCAFVLDEAINSYFE